MRGRFGRVVAASAMALLAGALLSSETQARDCWQCQDASVLVDSLGPFGQSVSTGASVVVSFNTPMAPNSVLMVIQPHVVGAFTWLDNRTLAFQPARFAFGVTYQVTVGWQWDGWRLAGHPARWRFTTAASPALVLLPGPKSMRVPILMYHYIRVNPDPYDPLGFALSVTPANFSAQMDWLQKSGYHTVTMQDLDAYLTGVRGLPSKPIVLTFDDGYADFYTTALPILRSHGFTAVSYVVSSFIGWRGYMTSAQFVYAQSAGFEIGSHTVSHANLVSQTPLELQFQLMASKRALEKLLGRPVVSFCYPYGRFGSREVAAVQAAGYQDATTEIGGTWHSLADRYYWTRLRVSGGEGLADFVLAVETLN